uniref:TOG domain-containing protein n=1 Tax=Dunaliella tertiolecta TaxID=3047 RepID=A0A7S3QX62_DUNTE
MYAARTRLAPAMFERLKLRSADMPHPHHGGATSTPTAATQPNTPASVAEGIGYSPMSSAKSATGAGFWEKSMKPLEELSTAELMPLPEPERSLRSAINKMMQANNADRKELDWQGQHEAINDSRRIVAHHPEVLRPCLHEFVRAAVPALDQLRSFTVKNAIALMQEMFVALGRQLDRELDDIVPMLLKKAGEISNAGRENFLAAEADRALAEMCRRVSEHRAMAALCACANHKSMHVRAKVSSHLDGMMEQPNVRTMLASNQQCLDRLFKVAAGFLNEGGLETRTYGKRILFNIKMCLGSKADLDRLVSQVHPEMLARKVSDVVDNLNSLPPIPCTAAARGAAGVKLLPLSRQASGGGSGASFTTAGYPPTPAYGFVGGVISSANGGSKSGGVLSGPALQDAASTQAHHNQERGKHSISAPIGGSGGGGPPLKAGGHFGLRGPSSSNSRDGYRSRAAAAAQAGGLVTDADGSSAVPLRAAPSKPLPTEGFDLDQQEALSKNLAGLGARDFRERIEVLKSLEAMAQQQCLAAAPEAQLVELLDSMTARISEGNAKVAIQALETLGALFHCLRGRCSVGLNTLIPALAATLGSSNDKIRNVGVKATDALVEAVDPVLLIQNFAHCASHSSLRGRPLLVERLLVLARALWPVRPTLVLKHALPAAFSLLNDTKGDGRTAANTLLMGLARFMGPQLLEHAVGLQPVLQQRVSDAVALAGNNQ